MFSLNSMESSWIIQMRIWYNLDFLLQMVLGECLIS